MLDQLLPLIFQLCLASLVGAAPIADDTITIMGDPAQQWGTGGGIVGFIILILDIIVWIEVLKSNRPPLNKVLWCVLVFVLPLVGMIIYWLFSNRKAHNTYEPIG